ncbi:MAG: hypothetical protein Unbinned6224contig1001_24 [Prokaryotic dsDNA virus sp.]|nr:MAG: hypothetical protein Unbinned6224contig1001_24 [Prokaryotic dsDNA virus sp.]|tara:strand:- start:7768 stop:7965 length:198 start_codon:yes stop_codon:yes gene_type:complete
MSNALVMLVMMSYLNSTPIDSVSYQEQYTMMEEDVKKKKKKGKKIGGNKGKKSKKGFFSKVFGSK